MRRQIRLAAGVIAVTAGLVLTGCTASSPVAGEPSSHASASPAGSTPATTSPLTGTGAAPAISGFASPPASVVPPNRSGPPADPFAGTPADHWANGAAGIVLPTAKPIGPYPAAQVESAYQTTRKLLVAADLDTKTLLGGPPTAFAALLTHDERNQFEQGLNKKGVDKQGFPLSTRPLVMSFAPGSAQLIGSVIKVRGTMHAQAAKGSNGNHELDVHVDYLFVYPIDPPHDPADWMRVVTEASWTVVFTDWQGAATTFEPGVEPVGDRVAGVDCGTTDGYEHPDYPVPASTGPQPSVSPSGTPVDPYQAGQPNTGKCQAMTGT